MTPLEQDAKTIVPDASIRATRFSPLKLAVAIVPLIAAMSLWVPFRTFDFHQINFLDYTWQLILHWAIANHRHFGGDLVFTYGPYGFLATDVYYPDTFSLLLLVRTAIVIIFGGTLCTIGARLIASPFLLFAWLVAIVLLIGPGTEILFPTVCVALFVAYFYAFDGVFSAWLIPLIPVLALLGLTKFTLFLAGAMVIGAIAIDQAAFGRRARAGGLLLGYGISVALLWLLARQRLGDLWPFVINSLAISRGYSEAMAVRGPTADIFDFLVTAISIALVLAAAGWRARRWRGILPAIVISLMLFLVFKEAFVRHDSLHAPHGGALLFIFALLLAPGIWHSFSEKIRVIACAGLLMLAGISGSSILARNITMSMPRLYLRNAKIAASELIDIANVASLRSSAQSQFDSACQEMRARRPLPPVTGTVDMYGHHQALLLANHYDYSPRPVIQSYAAYTPQLAGLNARHLLGESAPSNLLLDFANFGDGRFPTLSDNVSFPEMLAGYEPGQSNISTIFPLLVKRAVPRAYSRTLLSSATIQFDQPLSINASQNSLLWATIQVHPTLSWKVAAFLYRPPILWIEVKTHDGTDHFHRLIASMAQDGFILSPLVETSEDFPGLYFLDSRKPAGAGAVERITISWRDGPWDGQFFKPDIDAHLYRLDFKDR